jgi:hypothetical protein
MARFTAFCQDTSGRGTIWIDTVDVADSPLDVTTDEQIAAAITAARDLCAYEWGYEDAADVHVLGLSKGDIQIVHWEDLNDD